MKKITLTTALALSLTAMSTACFAGDDLSVSVTVDYVTDYVFRGVSLADTAIQPGVEVSKGDFTVGGWYSTGIGDTSIAALDEFDLYADYGFSLSEAVSLNVGATYYHYPQGGSFLQTKDGAAGTYEVYASLGFDTALSPTVTAYYDFTLEGLTLEGGVGHSIPAGEKSSLDLGLTAGLVDGDNVSWEYGTVSAALNYAFTDAVGVYAGANYTLSSSDDEGLGLNYSKAIFGNGQSDLLWVGTGISAGF